MIKKYLLFVFFALITIHLTSCATNADPNAMSYIPSQPSSYHSYLKRNIAVGYVGGGHDSIFSSRINNPQFKKALQNSLNIAGLQAYDSHANYTLNATIKELTKPFFGINATAELTVLYTIVDNNNEIIYKKDISSSYTAKYAEAFVAAERFRLAVEGTTRENIKILIKDLYKLR